MFKPLSRALAALALGFAPAAHAQQATTDADPALWVVKDADTTIYLFGTIHILKPGLGWFDEGVRAAFDKSGQVVLEMVEPDAATMQGAVIKSALNIGGPTVTSQIPADKRAAYAAAMTGIGATPEMFDSFDPWFPAITLTVGSLPKYGYDPNSGAEKIIAAAAKEAGKPVEGLETLDQQLGYFDGLPPATQIKFLVLTLDQLPRLEETLGKMVTSWGKGDPDGLAALMNQDMDEIPEVNRVLLSERNARWADWIEKRMAQPGTVFVAVGAGHLAGPESVQAYLARRKLTATRVQY
jgi:uncharacterized protein YbaP (TraB family)